MIRRGIYTLLGILLCFAGYGQGAYFLEIVPTDTAAQKVRLPAYEKKYSMPEQRTKAVQDYLFDLYDEGFLAATIDSSGGDSVFTKIYLTRGPRYKWASIRPGNVQENFLARSGYREKLYFEEPIRFNRVRAMQKKILEQYENNGYPFAVIRLDSIQIRGDRIHAALDAQPGPSVLIDSITVEGKGRIAPAYLYSYLGLKPGKPYNESAVLKIESRLKGLPFVAPSKKPVVEFSGNKAKIRLFLDKRNASQFYGIVGIVPQSDLNGGFLITGDVKLRLHNLLRRGELLDLQWQRLQTATQSLKVQAAYPFLLNTPIGLDGKFDFFRVDSAFFTININASVLYLMQGMDNVRIFYNYQTSRKVLPEDGQSTLSGIANTDIHYYGLGFQRERLDYRLNPRKGYVIQMQAAIGTKKIFPTPQDTINPVDTLSLNTVQGNMTGSVEGYIPVWKRFTIKLGARAGWQINPYLFRNELFRIGGLRTLRGFDEESIYSSMYAFGTFEFRFLIDEGSYVSLFSDAGYYERSIRNEYYSSYVIGFGAGITFATKVGLFTLNYALGTQKESPVDFRRSKIHFGYINYF